jgi:hypothetical protein
MSTSSLLRLFPLLLPAAAPLFADDIFERSGGELDAVKNGKRKLKGGSITSCLWLSRREKGGSGAGAEIRAVSWVGKRLCKKGFRLAGQRAKTRPRAFHFRPKEA